ncbi:UNVERIFIED_CONTAM: phytosulfokine [Sesamum calycinum]|uniref:Phytosulfokine n=2 Tax=Sesamum TaxID=4181 RepID=A0AAE2BXW7_9LAMI|nr:phytosulfokine [Sesamum angolense]
MAMATGTLFTTTLLLLLAFSHVLARPGPGPARPGPAFHDVTPMETQRADHNEAQKVVMDRDKCVGLGEDECMMRRTLEAQLDYIYTQKQKQP